MREPMAIDTLRQILRYDPSTGIFVWRVKLNRNTVVGSVAGTRGERGRIEVCVAGRKYKAHRIAWAFMTGSWPSEEIDHINGDPGDNRWSNLRSASRKLNSQNERRARKHNRTGLLGVSRENGRFRAVIRVNGRQMYLGGFPTAAEAHAAYVAAKRKLHEGNML